MTTLAQDKRSVDHDGRLRVPGCRISKANVCPYFGREIPGYESLGLDGDRVYMMYRDPEALREAASTWEGIPLLSAHVPVTADSHAPDITVGTVTNPRFEYPYLVADLVVWTDDAKELIESRAQDELSSAYRYEPVMGVGTSPEGLRYDGRMIMLKANHLALVREGRAGPDVRVADELPKSMRFNKFLTALAKMFPTPPDANGLVALDSALAEEIEAMDEMSDEDKKKACDSYAKELGKDAESLTDEEKAEAYKRAASDGAGLTPRGGEMAPRGMDEATVNAKIADAVAKAREGYVPAAGHVTQDTANALAADSAARARTEVHALYAARDAVAEKAGVVNLETHKTAEAVYRYALDKLSVPHKDVPAEALAALYAASVKTPAPTAQDAAPFNVRELFPYLSNVTRG